MIDATAVLAHVEQLRTASGVDVTVTHIVGAAVGRVLRAVPEVRARVVLGRIVPFSSCDVGFAVDIGAGADLAPYKVERVDEKTTVEIASELADGVDRLRGGRDEHHRRSSSIIDRVPTVLLRPALAVAGFLVGGLGVGAFGQPGFPLGAAFVSNVGTLGLDDAFLAPVPFARVPLYVAIGAVRDAPAVVDGHLTIRPQFSIVATGDHRLVDGAHAGRIATMLRQVLADPAQLDHVAPVADAES